MTEPVLDSFRRRRLSLPRHQLASDDATPSAAGTPESTAASAEAQQHSKPPARHLKEPPASPPSTPTSLQTTPPDMKQTFRKRRLSMTLNSNNSSSNNNPVHPSNPMEQSHKHPKRSSKTDSLAVAAAAVVPQTRTLHSTELLKSTDDNDDNNSEKNHVLYQQTPLPPPMSKLQGPTHSQWQTTHAIMDPASASKLPFPREVVGTFSCHGVEPVYEEVNDDSDEEDDEYQPDPDAGPEDAEPENAEPPIRAERAVMAAKINQDRGGVAFPYGNSPRTALFAVYDGHGQGGELISQFTLYEMQRRLEIHPLFHSDLPKAMHETFKMVDQALLREPLIQPTFAGTTACVVLLKDNLLTMANVGDSRAVMARRISAKATQQWDALDLTMDQNPDLPEEQRRIMASGGYVSPPPGPGLSARVWLDPQFTQIGLAMARSIGDHAVATVGVISDPIVTTHELDPLDDFMILASDGVWEFLTSAQAVDIVGQNLEKGATQACRALILAAAARWHEEEGEYRDDITAVVVRLSQLWEKTPPTAAS